MTVVQSLASVVQSFKDPYLSEAQCSHRGCLSAHSRPIGSRVHSAGVHMLESSHCNRCTEPVSTPRLTLCISCNGWIQACAHQHCAPTKFDFSPLSLVT